MSGLLWAGLAALLTAIAAGYLGLRRDKEAERIADRFRALRSKPALIGTSRLGALDPARALDRLGAVLRDRLLGPAMVRDFVESMAGTGLKGMAALGAFVAAKIVLVIALPALAIAGVRALGGAVAIAVIVAMAAGVAGLLLPDVVMGFFRRRRDARIKAGLADALDLMVICTEAGMPLESAIDRVSRELALSAPDLSNELRNATIELQMAQDRREALIAIGTRTRVLELRRLTQLLAETLRFGTPLAEALRTLSADMRQQQLVDYEERAAKLPVLLTLPMIVFILPCVFVIVGGPAVITLLATLGVWQ